MRSRIRPFFLSGGFTLVETLVTLAVFGVIVSGVYAAYLTQLKYAGRETRVAETDVELVITKKIIERDLAMAGYGLADDYGAASGTTHFNTVDGVNLPRPARATDDGSDTLTLMGTALGIKGPVTQRWSYITDAGDMGSVPADPPSLRVWGDAREDLRVNERVILIEPTSKRLLAQAGEWLFRFNGGEAALVALPSGDSYLANTVGTLIYGLAPVDTTAAQPYYSVRYYLGYSNIPQGCAPGTGNLLRAESRNVANPDGGDPLIACVRDFQVAFGLDTDENGSVETWDDGGVIAAGYDVPSLKRRLKQIRLYLLVQQGNKDRDYTYPSASVLVGDSVLDTGRSISLTTEQRRYRWQLVTVSATPRNIR